MHPLRNALIAFAVALGSSACLAGPTDANEANFLAAIKKRAHGERACLQSHIRIGQDKAKKDVYFFEQNDQTRAQLEAEYAALKELGLITEGVGYLPFPKNMVWTKDLKFTEAGRSVMKEEVSKKYRGVAMAALCYATPQPTKVIKWEGPIDFMGNRIAKVTFTYRLDGVAAWANNEKFLNIYPELRERLKKKDVDTGELALKLTNVGWE